MTYNNEHFLREAIKMLTAHYLENMAECVITPEEAKDKADVVAINAVMAIKKVEKEYQVTK